MASPELGADAALQAIAAKDTIPPTVAITAPASGAVLHGSVTFSATASDNVGVASVQFLLSGQPLAPPLTTAPYDATQFVDTLVSGAYTLTAVAADARGNRTTSAGVAVRVDNTPPTVTVTAPAPNAPVGGVISLAASAADDDSVAWVQFVVDTVLVGTEIMAPPYVYDYNTDTLPNGTHLISARVSDRVGLLSSSTTVPVIVNNPPPRDVVVIVADDQRFDLMPYMPLTTAALRAQTVRFTRAFATTSTCCPSRSSILTGRYAHNHHVLTNAAPSGGATVFDPSATLATALQAAGYRTALIGKYLNQYELIAPQVPPGWTDFEAMLFNAQAVDAGYLNYRINTNGTVTRFGPSVTDYSTDVLTSRAVQFIQQTHPRQPLFLYFTPFAPHLPATPHPLDAGKYAAQPPWRPATFNEADVSDKPSWVQAIRKLTTAEIAQSDSFHRHQLEALQALDRGVDQIIATLKATQRWKNTLVIYLSDNGYAWGEHRLRDRKECPYEECIRVPMWVRAPGLTFRTDTQLVANIDVAPTVAAWAGVPLPGVVNGSDLMPLLRSATAPWRTELLIEHLGQSAANLNSSGVRDARYLYNEYENGERELYDLKADPLQRTNVASSPANAALVAAMQARLAVLKTQ